MAKPRRITIRNEILTLWHRSGHNISLLSKRLGLDEDTTRIMVSRARAGRAPVGREAEEEFRRLIHTSRNLGSGPNEARIARKYIGDKYVVRWFKLDEESHVPRKYTDRSRRMAIVVKGRLRGRVKYAQHKTARDIDSAWDGITRELKDYGADFVVDDDGYTLKLYEETEE